MTGLDVIDPPAGSVSFRGVQYVVGPLKIGQLPAFARAIKPVSAHIEQAITSGRGFQVEMLLDLIAEHGESVIEAVSVATGIPGAELREGDAAELLALIPAVLRTNKDFLIGRLTPAVRAAVRATLAPGTGQTQSKP